MEVDDNVFWKGRRRRRNKKTQVVECEGCIFNDGGE